MDPLPLHVRSINLSASGRYEHLGTSVASRKHKGRQYVDDQLNPTDRKLHVTAKAVAHRGDSVSTFVSMTVNPYKHADVDTQDNR